MLRLPIELEIGLRYTRSKRRKAVGKRDGFLSFISGISTAGIALGVASLIVVLSVMNGFQKEVRDRMLSVLSHVEITSPDGLSPKSAASNASSPDSIRVRRRTLPVETRGVLGLDCISLILGGI